MWNFLPDHSESTCFWCRLISKESKTDFFFSFLPLSYTRWFIFIFFLWKIRLIFWNYKVGQQQRTRSLYVASWKTCWRYHEYVCSYVTKKQSLEKIIETAAEYMMWVWLNPNYIIVLFCFYSSSVPANSKSGSFKGFGSGSEVVGLYEVFIYSQCIPDSRRWLEDQDRI